MDPNASPFHWVPFPMTSETIGYLTANCVTEAFVLLVVGLRFYSRITTGSLGWDDWWVLIATFLCIGTLIQSICMDILGSGYPSAEVAINLSSVLLLVFIIQPFFLFTIAATKISVCFFYLRVFVGRGMRIATFVTMAIVGAWAVAHFLAAVFICTPVSGAYDLRLAAVTKCGNQSKFFQSGLSINVVLDAVIMVLPLWTIWNLNMRLSDKIGLSLAFSIGLGMMTVGIIRAIYVVKTAIRGDLTSTLPTNLFLTVFEQQLAIIMVSIPMLRPLWARYRARVGGYNIEEGEKDQSYKKNLPNGTFGGSGKKSSRGGKYGGVDDTILQTNFELRTVSNQTHIKGPDADGRSVSEDWDGADAGSETRLPVQDRSINVREQWQVSHA